MSTSVTTTPGAPPRPDGDGPRPGKSGTFGLPTATALVIGSVIGTGVFALPTALAPYGPTPSSR